MTLNDYRISLELVMGPSYLIPDFDLSYGVSSKSRFLFLLEAPGPKVLETGLISLNNPDPSARNLKNQLLESQMDLSDVILWNTIPWISRSAIGVPKITGEEIERASKFCHLLPQAFPHLQAIVFVGDNAVKQLVHYCTHLPRIRFCMAHHPSGQSMNGRPDRWNRNVAVFRSLKEYADHH